MEHFFTKRGFLDTCKAHVKEHEGREIEFIFTPAYKEVDSKGETWYGSIWYHAKDSRVVYKADFWSEAGATVYNFKTECMGA